MGHHISALISRDAVNADAARRLDLPVIQEDGYAIIALDENHSDFWAEKLGVPCTSFSGMIRDSPVTLAFAERLGLKQFALVQTEYFGGVGEQFATVYEGTARIFVVTEGGINAALNRIGVNPSRGLDEFDTLGLGKYRDFSDRFEKYW